MPFKKVLGGNEKMRSLITSAFALIIFIGVAVSYLASCGGPNYATANMTITVNPSSWTHTYLNTTTSYEDTGTVDFQIVVLKEDGTAAPGITVIGRLNSAFLDVIYFDKCGKQTKCSCTTGSSGYCILRAIYKYGTAVGEWYLDILFYSGPINQTVRVETKAQ